MTGGKGAGHARRPQGGGLSGPTENSTTTAWALAPGEKNFCELAEELYDPAGQLLGHLNGANGVWWEEYAPFDGRVLWYYTQSAYVSSGWHWGGRAAYIACSATYDVMKGAPPAKIF